MRFDFAIFKFLVRKIKYTTVKHPEKIIEQKAWSDG